MPNPNPFQARLVKRRRGRPGNLAQVLRIVWAALLEADGVLQRAEGDPEVILKAVHAISQCAGQYAKLIEIGEWESRLTAVETAIQEGRR
jgi:hypothetical protein